MSLDVDNLYLKEQVLRFRNESPFLDALAHVLSLREADHEAWCSRLALLLNDTESVHERILLTYLQHLAPSRLHVVPQFQLPDEDAETHGPPVRVDLLVAIRVDPGSAAGGLVPVAAVECSDSGIHSRYKLRHKLERARDRALEQLGLPLIELTTAEISADPLSCALRVLEAYQRRFEELLRVQSDAALTRRVLETEEGRQAAKQRLVRRALTRKPIVPGPRLAEPEPPASSETGVG